MTAETRAPRGPDWPRTLPEIRTCTNLDTQIEAAQDFIDMCNRQAAKAKEIRDAAIARRKTGDGV